MVVIVVGAWTSTASRGPRSLRIYQGLLGCLLRDRQLLLLLHARLRLAWRDLQIVARELARRGADVLVLRGLVLHLDRLLLLWLIRSWLVDYEPPLVAFVRLPHRTDLSALPSTHLLCLILRHLVHGTHIRRNSLSGAVHLPKIPSRRLIKLLMFLKLCLQELPSHVLLILLLLLVDNDLVLDCTLGSGLLLLWLLAWLLLEEIALGHLLLHLQLLLLLDAEELIGVLGAWAVHVHLERLLWHVLYVLLWRVVLLLRGRWVVVDEDAIAGDIIIEPDVLRRLYLVDAAIRGCSCHGSRVAGVPLAALAVVQVLLLSCHHLLLV